MPRYIDVDEFVKRVIQYPRQSTKTIGLALEDTPTADVVEVKHGKWVYYAVGGYHCSECHCSAPFWCMAATQNLSKFCPNCGAKMDGKETENATQR